MRAPNDYLNDILEQIQRIETFTEPGRDAFLHNDETQYAVILAYVFIGKIAKHLPTALLDAHPQIDWRQIKGFRDFLIHSYHKIKAERVWEAVEDLPHLRVTVEAMQRELQTGKSFEDGERKA